MRGTQPRLCIEQKLLGRLRRDQALSLTLFEDLDPTSGKKAVSILLVPLIYPALSVCWQEAMSLPSGQWHGVSMWDITVVWGDLP